MEMKAVDAAKAYASALGRNDGMGQGAGVSLDAGQSGSSFADLVTGAIKETASATQASENMVAQNLNKEANVLDVVTAVNNAEMTVQTVVAVRDKVVNAYKEIMRMPI